MTLRIGRVTLVAAMVLALGAAAGAETLEDVEKNIIKAAQAVKSYTADIAINMELSMGAMTMKSSGGGTTEFLRKGDKVLSRTEMKLAMTMNQGENEQKMEQSVLTILDGEHSYTLSDQLGQKTAVKAKLDPTAANMGSKEMFAKMREDATLKLLPEAKVGDDAAYAIEATPKQPQGMAGKSIFYFNKKNGVLLKMLTLTPEDKPMQTVTFSNFKMDVDLKPERFVFEAPPGVPLQDMTKNP